MLITTRAPPQALCLLASLGRGILCQPPLLIGLFLVFWRLHVRMVGECLHVHLVKVSCECQPHAQHVRLATFFEVCPRWYVFERRHGEALGAGESNEWQAMLRSRSESLATYEMNDDSRFDSESLGLVHRKREACYDRELGPRQSGAILAMGHWQDGDPLWFTLVEGRATVIWELANEGLRKCANSAHATACNTSSATSTRSGEPSI